MPIALAREDVTQHQRRHVTDDATAAEPRRRLPARTGAHLARRALRAGDDRGSSSVEFTILFPIIVVLLLGGPQLALWYFHWCLDCRLLGEEQRSRCRRVDRSGRRIPRGSELFSFVIFSCPGTSAACQVKR